MVVASAGAPEGVGPKSEDKRIMLKRFLLLTIATLMMLPALADKPADKGNKGGSSVSLGVVFCESNITPAGLCGLTDYNFASDNGRPYIDGQESVSTSIGKFRFGLNVGLYGTRHFRLDLNCERGTGCSGAPTLVNDLTYGWNVFATSPDGAQYLEMAVDSSKRVNLQLEFFDTPDRENNWRIMFNPSLCDEYVPDQVEMAKVTRYANDIWIFEAGADDYACLELRKGGRKHYTYHGRFKLPFKIIATAQ
jgi:hypothetical protein